MKKSLKILLFISLIIFILISTAFLYAYIITKDQTIDTEKLVNPSRANVFLDANNSIISEQANGIEFTEISQLNDYTKNAFIAVEDKRFYEHNGIDFRGLFRATLNNIKTLSFKQGGSTITQQLIKNTHLSNKKTIKRKLIEFKLALDLEKKFSKDEILEKYLNTIYFGDNCYGITKASKHYFNKIPQDLTLNESAMLAGLVKAPSHYSPLIDIDKCNQRKNLVLLMLKQQGYITQSDYELNVKKDILSENVIEQNEYDYLWLCNRQVDKILKNSPYSKHNLQIKTFYNENIQKILKQTINSYNSYDFNKSAILMDKNGNILSYYSTCGEVNRQLGSTIKPIAVYAPAINKNVINPYTKIKDEKINFNGYSPSNYNNVYRGDISVKDALSFSSNVCAVKVLNYLGVNNAVEVLNKLKISVCDEDKGLSLALGATKNGATLSQITGAYNVFSNSGYFSTPNCINSINSNKSTVYKNYKEKVQVIEDSTAFLMCDILKNTVQNGTAKKLSSLNGCFYAKTGTVGNQNGNTDAYIISFNKDYTLGVWCGSYSNKLLSNNITGGNIASDIALKIWEEIYNDSHMPEEIEKPDSIVETYIDKYSYENLNKIELADSLSSPKDNIKAYFKQNALPKTTSNRFSKPKIENYKISVINNRICIQLCHAQNINCLIYRLNNKQEKFVYDTFNNTDCFLDENLKHNSYYQYVIVPYSIINGNKVFGEKILTEKIKTPNELSGENWWDYD